MGYAGGVSMRPDGGWKAAPTREPTEKRQRFSPSNAPRNAPYFLKAGGTKILWKEIADSS